MPRRPASMICRALKTPRGVSRRRRMRQKLEAVVLSHEGRVHYAADHFQFETASIAEDDAARNLPVGSCALGRRMPG